MVLVLGVQSWVVLSSRKLQNVEVKLLPLKILPLLVLAVEWISPNPSSSPGVAAPGWRELLSAFQRLSCVSLQLLND